MRKTATRPTRRTTTRSYAARVRALAAVNRVRRGQSKTLSAAARTEGTTVATIRKLLPAALRKSSPGERIRVKAGDPYAARVEILQKDIGATVVTARGSRQRDLAGHHRAVWLKVLRGLEPPSSLHQFRGLKVGGHELLSYFDQLSVLAHGGALDSLESLYVSPETHG